METGAFSLDAFLIRLEHAIDRIGSKRISMDTMEMFFSALENKRLLRAELKRLFQWLKDKDVTTLVIAERGDGSFTRSGLEEYVCDCVLLLGNTGTSMISFVKGKTETSRKVARSVNPA